MENSFTAVKKVGNNVVLWEESDITSVELYTAQNTSPFYNSGNKIGDLTNTGEGNSTYVINLTVDTWGTIVVTTISQGVVVPRTHRRKWFDGDNKLTLDPR